LYGRQCIVFGTDERVDDHRTGGEFEGLFARRGDGLVEMRIPPEAAFVLGRNVARFILKFYCEQIS
jgi:hypothetical protein